MIRWAIDETPCGKGILTLEDEATGFGFMLMFADMDKLRRFFEDMLGGTMPVPCGPSLEGMSDFVNAFPEMF